MPAPLIALGIGTGLSALASFLSGRNSANAATQASDAQAAAATYAADLNLIGQREALAAQLGQYEQTREDQAPWMETGRDALAELRRRAIGGGDLMAGFTAPAPFDPSNVRMDPGFDFRTREAQRAIERAAAARGGALSPSTMREIARYTSDLASDEYGRAYDRAASEYDRDFTNRFNVFQANQGNAYNRLASIAGLGQTAVNTITQAGQNRANATSDIVTGTAARNADLATQAGNARASGYVGRANAWNGASQNAGYVLASLFGGR